ncbi:MAG: hypothetical protein Ta2B_22470 [Termitinemataceae bacterium]|nr:MAG: hypothetical protein Ta2B_22470 [Termitinemataceae bacterium]
MPKPFSLFEKFLVALISVSVLVLVIVTAVTLNRWAAVSEPNTDDAELQIASNAPVQKIWTGIGRLRIPLKNDANKTGPSAIIINVAFPYNNSDRALTEELALNNKKFRSIVMDYFVSTSSNRLSKAGERQWQEDEIKTTLLNSFNSLLRLGNIQTLYFSEFTIIE